MNLLAIDTATERCSVALRIEGRLFERSVDTQRGHADIVLTMVDDVLRESGRALQDLNGIAYGRGPGAFTGVRIAVGVVQGLAFGARLPTVGISTLAAVAHQAPASAANILACMDARMNEVYWAVYRRNALGTPLSLTSAERVDAPDRITLEPSGIDIAMGTGMAAYPALSQRFAAVGQLQALPRAADILLLAEHEFSSGRGASAFAAQPVYLRDQVTFVKPG